MTQKIQQTRYGSSKKYNSSANQEDIKNLFGLSESAKIILDTAAEKLDISPRSYIKTIRVARTIADLDSSKDIDQKHIVEALQYRNKNQ